MAKTLEQVLGSVNLLGLIQGVTQGIPNPLPDAFMTVSKQVLGRTGRYVRVQGQRQTARMVAYGSPAVRRQQKGIDEIDVMLLHSFEEQMIDVLTLQRLRQYDSYEVQNLGEQEVARHAANFAQLFRNLRIATAQQMLATGVVYYDSDGNLLHSSSGAAVTVSAQMPAGNQTQLNMLGAGSIISASWATATTDIPLQLRNLKSAALKLTGYPLALAIYGKNIPTYMTNNDYVMDYLSRNYPKATPYLALNELPDLFGFQWIPAYASFFEDYSSTNRDIVGDDTVIFCPVPSIEWWQVIEGSYQVPNSIDIRPEQFGIASAFRTVFGPFGYSLPAASPPTYISYYGDTFIAIPTVPSALCQADVTP